MLLKSLEIQGFKTFPDKTTLKFEKAMVAVVGPNGSGKSNVSDAIRWVLGEQSAKELRCSKMEDVIFKGTATRKAQGYAEVTMNIDNSDRMLNFDGDNIAVTRRYYRSGDSEYLINKASVRLKDINELFMDTGLGRDGYSMIGQGKIDAIVSAKSEDRREIFEEASGISRYRYRKEEAQRKLDKAEENLVRLRDILAELQERVEPLRVQSEKAQKFIEYDTEKTGLEIGIWVETLKRSGRILRDHEDKIAISQNQHSDIEREIEEISEKIEKNFSDTNACTLRMESIRREAASLDEEATRTEGEISVLENDILHHNQNAERYKQEIDDILGSARNIDADIAEKKAAILRKEREIDNFNKKYISLADKLQVMRAGSDSFASRIDDAMIKMVKLNADIAEEKAKYSSAKSSLGEINNRGLSLDSAIAENMDNVSRLQQEADSLTEKLKNNGNEMESLNNKESGYSLHLETKQKKAGEIKAELDKAVLDFKEQERRAKLLEDLERNFEGFTQSVKVVMRETDHGTIKGIRGPVTKIIKTAPEYAVAIETALGGAMQNIVVENEADAKTAISMLKKKDAGRATFLPMTTIKGNVMDKSRVSSCKGFVGIASELVSCRDEYSGIRDSLLGRTAVADSLDNAVLIAKKVSYRFRVVTLDGQVVNAGGSLTGGSLARNSGLLSRSAEIERIRKNAAEIKSRGIELSNQHKEIAEEISKFNAELELARQEKTRCSEDRIKISAELAGCQKDIAKAEEAMETLKSEKIGAGDRIADLSQKMEEASQRINFLENELKETQQRVNDLNGSKRDQQSLCDSISQKLSDIKIQGFAAEKDKNAFENAVKDLEMRKTDSAGVAEKFREQIRESEESVQEINKNIDALRENVDKLRNRAESIRREAEDVASRREKLETMASELRQMERDAGVRRENIGHEIARLQERKDNISREYDTITAKLWEDYELTRREAEEKAIVIHDIQRSQRRLNELKGKIKALGAVNVAAVVEYKEVSERYEFMREQIGDIEKSRLELIKLIGELTGHMKEQFAERFSEINSNFSEIFRELFGGGTASLCFADESDILKSGIDIKVHPPGKIVSHIESLSGGEKALVAISVYFAIMKVNPPPFCMLDEVEAALDESNVRRFAEYLRRMNDKTQFIVVTHRRGTMESADMLYGVTMQDDGISKILALDNYEAEEKLGMKSS